MGLLLPKEQSWEIPDNEEIKLDLVGSSEFRDKDKGEIQEASKVNDEIQDIKSNLHKGAKEMKRIVIGLCQWKDGLLW